MVWRLTISRPRLSASKPATNDEEAGVVAVGSRAKGVGVGEDVGKSDAASSEGETPKDAGDVGAALDPLWLWSEGECSELRSVGPRERRSTVVWKVMLRDGS